MNKSDSTSLSPDAVADASTLMHSQWSQGDASFNTDPNPAHRLIVLVPADSDYGATVQRVWELANTQGAGVLLLGLCTDEPKGASIRRQLITMSALIQDGRVSVEAKVEFKRNWLDVVRSNWQTGDVIVCFAEQRAGLLHKPLNQILESNLNVPLYVISGLYPQSPPRFNWLSQIIGWMGSLGIIAGSFLLQIRLVSSPMDWRQTTLLILLVAAEFWIIWVWNNLFS